MNWPFLTETNPLSQRFVFVGVGVKAAPTIAADARSVVKRDENFIVLGSAALTPKPKQGLKGGTGVDGKKKKLMRAFVRAFYLNRDGSTRAGKGSL